MRLVLGKSKPALIKALRTRSRLSFTAVSGKSTRVNPGKPLAKPTLFQALSATQHNGHSTRW